MKQKLLSILLVLFPMLVSAQDSVEINGMYYNLNFDSKEAEVTYGNWSIWDQDSFENDGRYSGNISVPESVDYNGSTYNVISISDYAFCNCPSLTSVIIPSSVIRIGMFAFAECYNLSSIIIPNSVTSVGNMAFNGCGWYNNQPDGLIYVGKVAYNYKGTIPENTKIDIEEGTVVIAYEAFSGCSGLTSVTIPNSVEYIGSRAFRNCSGLTSLTIPNNVTEICPNTFDGCTSLISVAIPNTVTSIGDYAFNGCNNILEVKISITDLSDFCNNLIIGMIRDNIGKPVTLIDNTGNEIKEYIIPNNVTSIGNDAFYNCNGLTSVIISNNVTSIGISAFANCGGLETITIPNSVTSIGICAFEMCNGLKTITIPNNVTTINNSTFYGCRSLTSVIIPNSITSIGSFAFADCSGLTSVTLGNSVTSIGYYAFSGCSSLSSMTIPNSVTSIGEGAFSYADIPIVISLIKNPFRITDKSSDRCTFSQNTFNNATLYVPVGTIDKYKATEGWKDFLFMEEGTGGIDGIAKLNTDNILVLSNGSTLDISGADAGTAINVYDTAGRLVGAAKASTGTTSVGTSLSSGEIGIVKIGEKSVKVLIK